MKIIFVLLLSITSYASLPDWSLTPGDLCTSTNDDFDKFDYPENVARCKRHVTKSMKKKIAQDYGGIPEEEWQNYEFDHLLPLCIGGSNDLKNLWPEPLEDAEEKDKIENEVCRGMRSGTMKQSEAVSYILEWFKFRRMFVK